jgi:Enoyl-CoA hydratase/carnithine racemase
MSITTLVHCDTWSTAQVPVSPFKQASVHFDMELGAAFLYMNPHPRPCFTPELLQDIHAFHREVAERVQRDREAFGRSPIRYTVVASAVPNTYNLGGDLNRFVDLIRAQDRQGLLDYAVACIECAHQSYTGLDGNVTSIALVQGDAQGGGFEAALSCNVLIAERGVQMGFPEVLFNLFPGMGAYSFLPRRVNPGLAERLILSGELYLADELYEMGIVDVLAEAGQGEQVLRDYIRQAQQRSHAMDLIRHIRTHYYKPVPYEELLDITQRWVEVALTLTEHELKTMERLVRAQNRKVHLTQTLRAA